MTNAVKRIGVLTSGGDAPGMNAAIRAVVRSAIYRGIDCVGIRRGFNGLINGDFVRLDENSVNHIINRGGTMLYTARSEEFRTLEGQQRAAATCKLLGLDGIVGIGGDGTYKGAAALNALGLDTQVPAKLVYVSSGPYKRYEYGPYDIELRHRANRDLLDCSQITCTIVQALKALGRENVGDEEIRTLARNLTEEQAGAFLEESAGLTSWVADAAKKIWEAKHGQNR